MVEGERDKYDNDEYVYYFLKSNKHSAKSSHMRAPSYISVEADNTAN